MLRIRIFVIKFQISSGLECEMDLGKSFEVFPPIFSLELGNKKQQKNVGKRDTFI